jgi:hypothetical protein
MINIQFLGNDVDINGIIMESIHFKDTTAIDTLVELMENSVSILQNEFHEVSDTTTLALYNTHSKLFNKLLWILHDDVMQEAIRDVMNCIDDDDSGEETE